MKAKTNRRHHYAVILAGGQGTRFWPASRKDQPKQFIPIMGPQSLFQETLKRLRPLVPAKNILIMTGKPYRRQVIQQIGSLKIPKENILLEPEGKNTAPAICWAAQHLYQRDRNAVMAVFPADHLIQNTARFHRLVTKAFDMAEKNYLVTMGIKPHRPETGYGYIKAEPSQEGRSRIYKVAKFTEKPASKKAQSYIKSGKYYWNSGMFFWRADEILTEFAVHLPKVYRLIFGRSTRQISKDWSKIRGISIDYGILEKADNVVVIPAVGLGWSDLGSWEALVEKLPKDRKGNSLSGQAMTMDCDSTAIIGEEGLTVAVGLKDVIIIRSQGAVLVCSCNQSQKVRDIVKALSTRKGKAFL